MADQNDTIKRLNAELEALNTAVSCAIMERKTWMDAHMSDYAELQVGDEIYDLYTGRRLGVVSRLYRYWDGRDVNLDRLMNIDYEFETSPNCFDNTSRQNVKPGPKSAINMDVVRMIAATR